MAYKDPDVRKLSQPFSRRRWRPLRAQHHPRKRRATFDATMEPIPLAPGSVAESLDLAGVCRRERSPIRAQFPARCCSICMAAAMSWAASRAIVIWFRASAVAAGVTAYHLDYRLAPEHPFSRRVSTTRWRSTSNYSSPGVAPEDIVVSGDSAGGGLATALLLKARGRQAAAAGWALSLEPVARHGDHWAVL